MEGALQQHLQVIRIAIDRVADPDTAARCEKGVVALLHDPEPMVPALLVGERPRVKSDAHRKDHKLIGRASFVILETRYARMPYGFLDSISPKTTSFSLTAVCRLGQALSFAEPSPNDLS